MSFLSSLFTGSDPTISKDRDALGGIAGFSTGMGESNLSDATNFFHSILNGGATKVLAPQISSIRKQGNNQLSTISNFSNRSGGNNATANSITDKTTASINDFIASLTSGAASSLSSQGAGLLSQGASATSAQASTAQQILENMKNSILGQGVTGAVNYGESFLPIAHGG